MLGATKRGLIHQVSNQTPLNRGGVLSYALGSLGSGVYSTVPTVLLLYFCTEVLAIAPATAAVILFVPKAWAIVWDPLVGNWSDRCASRHGRRAPFMVWGTLGVAISFPALFGAPLLGHLGTAVYVGAAYFLLAISYSLYGVPYSSVPAEISDSKRERERILTWRMAFAMVGVLVGAGAAPHIVEWAGGGRRGYAVMGIVVSIACGTAMMLASRAVQRQCRGRPTAAVSTTTFFAALVPVWRHRDYRRLWLAYVLIMSGVALFLALSPYFVTRVIGRGEGDAGTALFALLGGTVAATPLWGYALQRWNAWRLLVIAIIAFVLVLMLFWTVHALASFPLVLPLYVALGIPFAGLQLVPFALLAHISHGAAKGGSHDEGLFTGVWTAGEKLGLAIGPGVAGIGLSVVGYAAGATFQTGASIRGVQAMMVLGPAALLVACLLMLTVQTRLARHSSV